MQVEIHTTEMQPKPWYKALYFQVLIAIVFGVLLGHFVPEKAVQLKVLGDGFIALVKMIIAPVIFITVSTGIASMADLKTMGRITGKAFLYFMTFSTLALVIGMLVGNLIQPGAGLHIDPKSLDPKSIQEYVDATQDHNLSKFVLDIIPKSLMSSLTGDSILQVLFVSIMFGIGITLTIDKSKPVLDFLHALSHPIFKIVEILMKLAPIGAFGAMGFTVGKFGLSVLLNLAGLVGTFYLTSAFFVLVVLGAVSWYNKFNIFK
ncbi:MAG: C4-dicarboxylate transporter DctA, partial [Flavobacterium sp.]